MGRPLALLLAVCVVATAGCGAVRDHVDALPAQAGSVVDQAQFCYSVARVLSGVEAGAVTPPVIDAAEEVLTQAPDDLRPQARAIVDALHDALDAGTALERSETFDGALQDLQDGTRTMCEPQG